MEIADDLALMAKAHAAKQKTTLRSLIERGLRLAIKADAAAQRSVLRDAPVSGRGLQPAFRNADWATIREAAYQDRGG